MRPALVDIRFGGAPGIDGRPRLRPLGGGFGLGSGATGSGASVVPVTADAGKLRTPIQAMLVGGPGRVVFPQLFGGFGFGGSTTSGLAPTVVAAGSNIGYRPAPLSESAPGSLREAASVLWMRRVVDVVNRSLAGKINATLNVTLMANATSTIVKDARISAYSAMLFTPLTATAATEQAAGGLYVSAQQSGQATIEHANNAQTDRRFRVVIIA